MEPMTKEESYAERRQLFKNIWETAMQEDPDTIKPTKVIKTLRLDDMDKYVIGKSKKEKLKNLRTLCNKILDFCDRQETDMLYDQIAVEPGAFTHHFKSRKLKTRVKRKTRKHKSLFASFNPERFAPQPKPTTSEAKECLMNMNTSKYLPSSYLGGKHMPIIGRALVSAYQPSSDTENMNFECRPPRIPKTRRRIVRKKRSKRKKLSEPIMHPISGTSHNISAGSAALKGRAVLRRVKQVLAMNKIVISRPHIR